MQRILVCDDDKAIVDAIENNDEEKARKLMGVHIDSVNQFGKEVSGLYPQFFI